MTCHRTISKAAVGILAWAGIWFTQGCGGAAGDEGAAEAPVAGAAASTGRVSADSPPLTEAQQARLELGRVWYEATCMACHQADGQGQEGLAPPFDPQWLARPASHLVRIVLHGLRGPVEVKGRIYELEMPTLWVLQDEQIAAAISYVRHRWGEENLPLVEPALVTEIRAATESRLDPWTAEELNALP